MTFSILRALSVLSAFLFLFGPAASAQFGQDDPFALDSDDPVTFRAVVDSETVAPGDSFRVAVVLEAAEEWYVYANPMGPGTGAPTVVTGIEAEGFRFEPARYLPGKKYSQEDIGPGQWVRVWHGKVPVFLEVRTASDLAAGERTLEVKVSVQACSDQSCVPIDEELTVAVTIGDAGSSSVRRDDPVFARFDEAKPAPGEEESAPAGATGDGAAGTSSGTSSGEGGGAIDFSRYKARELESGGGIGGTWAAILFGFIAGVLLNVMPCVLPVISIKIMSFVTQAHEGRRRVFGLGLAFSAGILIVFLVLAGLAAGAGTSWGDLFQSETFIVVMVSLVFVFALGMFDIYLILVPGGGGAAAQKEGYVGSFLKGILATFLATPCSGPFLGATLAWALAQPPLIIFLVFMSIGVGMAFPYVLLTAVPGLLKFMPKPGAWMETFKKIMGFVLLGTVVYLLTILRAELIAPTLFYLLILAFGAFLWGKYATIASAPPKRWSWRVALVLLAAAGAWVCFTPSDGEEIAWEDFSMAALERYSSEGRIVMVDFTADWCPNCKLVERSVLESEEVLAALAEKKVVSLLADITHADSPITAVAVPLRNQLGSRSIPFLAIFSPDAPEEPYILRDIYSVDDVLAVLEECESVGG